MSTLYSQGGQAYAVDGNAFAFGRTSVFYRGAAADGQRVCLKLFRRLEAVPSTDEFLREIAARQRMVEHPHVLPVLDYGVQETVPPRPFLVLPLCEGGDLRTIMGLRDMIPLHEALPFLRSVAGAIDHAHAAGLIHGDIKPENILFGKTLDDVYLADFGAAKLVVVRERVSAPAAMRSGRRGRDGDDDERAVPEGTELYLSPEELDDGRQTPRSDIYSFGFVAYELLTGRLPLDPNASSYRRMQAKIDGKLIDPQQANPQLSKAACSALLSALAVDPVKRPESATLFCDMLAGAASAPAVKLPPPPRSTTVFVSYAHEDDALRQELTKQLSILQRQGLITAWHDRNISAGSEWQGQISRNIDEAGIILLLVSPDFIASDYCYDIEMQRAIARHERGEATVVPIILRPVSWSGAPFARLQALPLDAKPITTWSNRDEAFLSVAEGIWQIVRELRGAAAV